MISSCLNDSHHTHTQAYTLFTQAAPCTLPLHIDKIFFNKWYFFAIITSFISAAHSARPTANKKFAPLFSSFSSRSCVFHLCMLHISLQLQLACTFFASVLMFELCLFFLFSSHLIWLTVFIYLFFFCCAQKCYRSFAFFHYASNSNTHTFIRTELYLLLIITMIIMKALDGTAWRVWEDIK